MVIFEVSVTASERPAIAHVVEDECAPLREALEIVENEEPAWQDNGLRPAADFRIIEADAVVGGDVTLFDSRIAGLCLWSFRSPRERQGRRKRAQETKHQTARKK